MGRRFERVNWDDRCPRCWLWKSLCLCGLFPPIALDTRITLWMDRRETYQTSNTGHFIQVALQNWAIYVFARRTQPGAPPQPPQGVTPTGYRSVILFDRDDAPTLDAFAATSQEPLNIIVPDATWRGATKMVKRVPLLASLPCVRLSPTNTTGRDPFIRQPPRPGAFSTLGAIARALGVVEGQATERHMLHLLETAVERHRWSCGHRKRDLLKTPIPDDLLGPTTPLPEPLSDAWLRGICTPGRLEAELRQSVLFSCD